MKYNLEDTFNLKPNSNIAVNVYQGHTYRISILKSNIIRFEYSSTGTFCDERTQVILNRNFGPVKYQELIEDGILYLKTDDVTLIYDQKKPSADGLQIKINDFMCQDATWKFGKEDSRNLKGTARTLDDIDGECSLESGLVSSAGFCAFEDSNSLVLKLDGFYEEKNVSDDYVDVYYMMHDNNVNQQINNWYQLSGFPPKIDRQYLGNWWSRYWEYDEDSLKQVVTEFKNHDIPLAVNIMDMDWHLVPSNKYGYGWTGFTWNRNLFPNPEKILEWQHDQGVLTALNLHPADGFREHEEEFEVIKKRTNSKASAIDFDVTNEKFMEAYFEEFIHLNQNRGVDFWWMDWQQGDTSKMKNLDPLFAVNHLHYLDAKKTQRKPLIFSRYSGLGSHRYPIGFSGDSHMTWDSLKFQPYFTSNSANVGYNYWSHDIGGHFHGQMDRELYIRWLQFGVFSPIMRLHSSKNIMIYKEPWNFDLETLEISKNYMQLRHQLISYIDTFNQLTLLTGKQLIRPLYHEDFDNYMSYQYKNSYYFGKDIIVSPIVDPIDRSINANINRLYLPAGTWYDWNGTEYNGNQEISVLSRLSEIPYFVRSGAIIVKDENYMDSHLKFGPNFTVDVFPGTNQFDLYNSDNDEWIKFKTVQTGTTQELIIENAANYNFNINVVAPYQHQVVESSVDDSKVFTIEYGIFEQKSSLFEVIKNFEMLSHQKNDIYNKLQALEATERIQFVNTLDINKSQTSALILTILKEYPKTLY